MSIYKYLFGEEELAKQIHIPCGKNIFNICDIILKEEQRRREESKKKVERDIERGKQMVEKILQQV